MLRETDFAAIAAARPMGEIKSEAMGCFSLGALPALGGADDGRSAWALAHEPAASSPLLAAIELHRLALADLEAAGPFDGGNPEMVALDNAEMNAMEALLAAPYSTPADAIALVSHLRPFVGEKKHPVLKDMGEVTCDVLAKVLDVCAVALAGGGSSAAACRE